MLTNQKAIIFVVVAVLLNVLAQYLLKFSASIRDPINGNMMDVVSGLFKVVFTPTCFLGLFAGLLASMFWILALNKLPLTIVYPFTALGFIAIMAVGFIVFKEPFTLAKIAGMSFILIGIAFISNT